MCDQFPGISRFPGHINPQIMTVLSTNSGQLPWETDLLRVGIWPNPRPTHHPRTGWYPGKSWYVYLTAVILWKFWPTPRTSAHRQTSHILFLEIAWLSQGYVEHVIPEGPRRSKDKSFNRFRSNPKNPKNINLQDLPRPSGKMWVGSFQIWEIQTRVGVYI